MKSRPTDEEFAELARKRDAATEEAVNRICAEQGWDRSKVGFHASHTDGCYCACPDGPCQHVWNGRTVPIGLEEGEDESKALGFSTTCSRCGTDAMSHDIRCAP